VPAYGAPTAVLSAALFASSGSFATSLLRAGWTPAAAVSVRLLVAALVLSIPAVVQLRRWRGSRLRAARTAAIYGLVPVAGCQLCYFQAVDHLSVAVALLLEYSGTLLVVAWQWARHRQVPGRSTVAGAVACVAGLALVLDLTGRQHVDLIGVLWGLGAAVGLAVYFVVASGGDDGLPPLLVTWGGLGFGAAAMLAVGAVGIFPLAAPRVDVVLAGTATSWVVPVLGLAVLAAALAYLTGIIAARALGARVASFVGLAEVIFAVIYAWLLLGERLTGVQLLGGALVVTGIALVRADRSGPSHCPDPPARVGPSAV
jgi:drug/metabolite transporter (DMT)-like permease